jgi:hypothetical protein
LAVQHTAEYWTQSLYRSFGVAQRAGGTTMNYPDELDTDDIEELASYIERRYPTQEIRIHDTETIHFGYWDKSHRVVSATLLDHIQAAGYRVLHTGVATVPRGETRRA